jgi:hypothetical protein
MPTPLTPLDSIDFDQIEKALSVSENDSALFDAIVNTPFQHPVDMALLFLGIVVFLQVNKSTGTIDRISLSKTEPAELTKRKSAKKFEDIKIPVNYPDNIIAKAIQSNEPQSTTDWQYLFAPALTPEEARFNQADGGIAFSAVYPLPARDGGALIFSYFQYSEEIGEAQRSFMKKYSELVTERLRKTR